MEISKKININHDKNIVNELVKNKSEQIKKIESLGTLHKKKKKHDKQSIQFTTSNVDEETFENSFDITEVNLPKKKTRHNKSLSVKEFNISNTDKETFENAIGELNANINDYDSNEYRIRNTKYSSNEIKDTSSENNFTTNSKNDEKKTLKKKKKKHDKSLSSMEYTISNTEEETFENAIEEFNDYEANKCGIGKNKCNSNEIKDTLSENNFNTNSKNNEMKTPKKKKKYDKSLNSKEFTTGNTDEETFENANINDYDSNQCGIRKKKCSSNEIKDTLSENNFNTNSKNNEMKTPKKKKKYDKSLNSKEFTTGNTDEETFENANINDYDSNQCGIRKKKCSSNEIKDTLSENNFNTNSKNNEMKTPKKKKKYDKSLNSKEFTTGNTDEETFENANINDYDSNQCGIRKKKCSRNEIKDTLSENNFNTNSKNNEMKTPKKKKKHDKSLSSMEYTISNTEEETFENININDYDSNQCGIRKKKCSRNEIKNTSSENNFTTSSKNDGMKTPKKEFTISNTEEETFGNARGEFNDNINDYESNECGIRKKKYSSNEIKDTSSKNNFTTNSKNDQMKTPKKKKKHNKSLSSMEFTISNTEEETFENANINNYDSNECGIRKKKCSNNKIKDTSSENNFTTNSKNDGMKTPKKKKKHDKSLSSMEYTISNTEEETFENININDYDSNQCGIRKKKCSRNEIKNTSSENNFTTSSKNDGMKTPKKEFTISNTEEETFGNARGEFNDNINDYESNECGIRKKNYSSNEIKDTSSKNNFTTNSKNDQMKTPKKKKKHNKSLSSMEYTISNTEEETFENAIEEFNENINDYVSNECGIGKNKYGSNEIKDTSSKNNFTTNSKNDQMKTPKNKKKYDKSLNSKEYTIGNTDEETFENANINNYDSNECGIRKKKCSNNKIKDTSSENNFNTNSKNDEIKTPKKEFTISNTEEEIFGNAIGEFNENINDYESNECGIRKKKYSSNEIKDTSLENNFTTNSKYDEMKTPKKEFTISNTEEETFGNAIGEFNENINVYESNECGIRKKKYSSNEIKDTSLENNFTTNSKYDEMKTPKKKKKRDKSLSSMEYTISNTEEETFGNVIGEFNENINDCDSINSVSRKRKYNNISNKLENKNFEITPPRKKKCDMSSNSKENNMENTIRESNEIEPHIISNYDHYFYEEDNTNETKLNMKDFDLINYLMKSRSSLINQKYSTIILKKLSSEIKNSINENCHIVSQSDIILLKAIGKSILERIIEKQNSAMSIEGLHIKVPLESQKSNQIHYVETALSKQPNKSKMDEIKKLYPSVKLGLFNEDEDNIIKKYWSKFQQEYHVSNVQPFLSNGLPMELPLHERLNFFRYISAGLPNRLLFSVHNRFNVLFNNQRDKLSFNSKEDKIIIKVENCDAIKNKYKVLCYVLNRSRLQLYRRVNTLKMQPHRNECIDWDSSRQQELFTNILLETRTENWQDLKNLKIKKETWIKISEHCGKPINYEKARTRWKFLSTMLFCEQPIKFSTFNLNTLKLLLEIQPKFWSDLNWIEITNKLYPGANSKVINTFFHWWVYRNVPSETRKNVKDALLYLSKHVINDEKKYMVNNDDPEYPRLTVDDNNLLVKILNILKTSNKKLFTWVSYGHKKCQGCNSPTWNTILAAIHLLTIYF